MWMALMMAIQGPGNIMNYEDENWMRFSGIVEQFFFCKHFRYPTGNSRLSNEIGYNIDIKIEH